MEDLSTSSANASPSPVPDAGTQNGYAAAAMTDPPLSGEARFFAAMHHTLSRFAVPPLLQYI
jgi:hypothetical protein